MAETTTAPPITVEELKRQWLGDPCWDIEDTEGFEAHRDELLAFRREVERDRRREELSRALDKADRWGCSTALVRYVEALEARIATLEAHQAEGQL